MIRFATVLQTQWDWRAAGNFVFGGAGDWGPSPFTIASMT